MNKEWNAVFDFYVNRIISPDGRDTFESNTELIRHINIRSYIYAKKYSK